MSEEDLGLDKSYKIPKRKFEEMDNSNGANACNPYPNTENPVLTNSYYNYYEPQGLYGQWQMPGVMYPVPFPPNGVNPITPVAQIYNTLSKIREKPKTYTRNIFKEVVPDVDDPTLPKELTVMFQPLFCKLCTAQLSSNVMAKMHYKSKNHEKKIRKFLVEYAQKTGEPVHKRAKVVESVKPEEDKNPAWFHCEVCDLPLTGKLHAESHYMGKNHQKALLGYRAPAGKGHYNSEGKWVRQSSKKDPALPEGEDNFGLDFRKSQDEATPAPPPNPVKSKFHCNICNVAATCQEQIEMHFKGQKHQKKMKHLGLQPHHYYPQLPQKPGNSTESGKAVVDTMNLSVYRTPSGDFYCPSCNLTLNSELQFKVHLRSKGHFKKHQKQ